jgi:hypothetical protein
MLFFSLSPALLGLLIGLVAVLLRLVR